MPRQAAAAAISPMPPPFSRRRRAAILLFSADAIFAAQPPPQPPMRMRRCHAMPGRGTFFCLRLFSPMSRDARGCHVRADTFRQSRPSAGHAMPLPTMPACAPAAAITPRRHAAATIIERLSYFATQSCLFLRLFFGSGRQLRHAMTLPIFR